MVTNRRTLVRLLTLVLVLSPAWTASLGAQPPAAAPARPKPAPLSGEALTDRIAPLVDDQVFLVLHADLAALDVEAGLQSVLADLSAKAPKDLLEEVQKGIPQVQPIATQWLADFLRCGGRDAYLLFSMERLPQDWAMLVVPLGEKADANALAGLFLTGRPAAAPSSRPAGARAHGLLGDETTVVAGGLLLIGPSGMVEDARQRLAPGGPSATRPSADNRKTL